MLNHREHTILVSTNSAPAWAASYTVTAYPVGAVATAGSSGTTITVDAGHSFRASDKILVAPGSSNVFSGSDTVQSVMATSIVMGSSYSISAGDKIVNLGPDTGTSSPNYDGSPVKIYSDSDGSTAVTSARVTASATGEYRYYHKGDGRFWELVRNGAGTVVDVIAGFGSVGGRINIQDHGCAGDGID